MAEFAPATADADPLERIATRYRRFGAVEARGRSPLYSRVAEMVAADRDVLGWLAGLPPGKRQPNLLFAATRYLYGTPGDAAAFAGLLRARRAEIGALMMVRSTQTNEPGRCAPLLAVLARLPQPLALIEVGASAGLCLLPDRYAYVYGDRRVAPSAPTTHAPPVFACRTGPGTPVPERNVEVAWRAGLDLHPIDPADAGEWRWLEALVWPGEEYRLPRLRAARQVALAHPPRVVAGDLRTDLADLAGQAPGGATLVVFHTAVLVYVSDPEDRARFARAVARTGAVWVANESAGCVPGTSKLRAERAGRDDLLLCVDGEPVAWTDARGGWIDWRAG